MDALGGPAGGPTRLGDPFIRGSTALEVAGARAGACAPGSQATFALAGALEAPSSRPACSESAWNPKGPAALGGSDNVPTWLGPQRQRARCGEGARAEHLEQRCLCNGPSAVVGASGQRDPLRQRRCNWRCRSQWFRRQRCLRRATHEAGPGEGARSGSPSPIATRVATQKNGVAGAGDRSVVLYP